MRKDSKKEELTIVKGYQKRRPYNRTRITKKKTVQSYKPSVKDIMDKYYEVFRGKNSGNKKDFFNSPEKPDHSDQDSDTDG